MRVGLAAVRWPTRLSAQACVVCSRPLPSEPRFLTLEMGVGRAVRSAGAPVAQRVRCRWAAERDANAHAPPTSWGAGGVAAGPLLKRKTSSLRFLGFLGAGGPGRLACGLLVEREKTNENASSPRSANRAKAWPQRPSVLESPVGVRRQVLGTWCGPFCSRCPWVGVCALMRPCCLADVARSHQCLLPFH